MYFNSQVYVCVLFVTLFVTYFGPPPIMYAGRFTARGRPEVVEVVTKDLIRKLKWAQQQFCGLNRTHFIHPEWLVSSCCVVCYIGLLIPSVLNRVPSTPDPSGMSVIIDESELDRIRVSYYWLVYAHLVLKCVFLAQLCIRHCCMKYVRLGRWVRFSVKDTILHFILQAIHTFWQYIYSLKRMTFLGSVTWTFCPLIPNVHSRIVVWPTG